MGGALPYKEHQYFDCVSDILTFKPSRTTEEMPVTTGCFGLLKA